VDGVTVGGVQPFKAVLDGKSITEYLMYWQVDNGILNQMYDSQADASHKEAIVDLSGWHWQATNQYTLTFVAKDLNGAVISKKAVVIKVF
jgi:hypothetical protein